VSTRVPVLTYHSIDESGSPSSTSAALFAKQIEVLKREEWRTIRVADAAAAIREKRALPARTLAITFDDGYENFAADAWPILSSSGFGATLFVVSGRLGARSDWAGARGIPSGLPLLDAASVRKLAEEGVEIGCHSATHASLAGLEPARLAEETSAARDALAETAGRPIRAFAYPYGAIDAAARAAAVRAFDAACTTRLGFAGAGSDPHALERIDAFYLRNLALVGRLDGPAARLVFRLRGVARRLQNRYG